MDPNNNSLPPDSSTSTGNTTTANTVYPLPAPRYYLKDPAVVQAELRSAVDPRFSKQLEDIFSSDAWTNQDQPLDKDLVRTLLDKIGDRPPTFRCPFPGICQTQAIHIARATEHVEKHLGHSGYYCIVCHRTFLRARDRDTHLDKYFDNSVQCPQCGAQIANTRNLPRHLRDNCHG